MAIERSLDKRNIKQRPKRVSKRPTTHLLPTPLNSTKEIRNLRRHTPHRLLNYLHGLKVRLTINFNDRLDGDADDGRLSVGLADLVDGKPPVGSGDYEIVCSGAGFGGVGEGDFDSALEVGCGSGDGVDCVVGFEVVLVQGGEAGEVGEWFREDAS